MFERFSFFTFRKFFSICSIVGRDEVPVENIEAMEIQVQYFYENLNLNFALQNKKLQQTNKYLLFNASLTLFDFFNTHF